MSRFEINLDDQITFLQDLGMKENVVRTSVSLSPETMRKGQERAKLFRLKFTHYIGMLIERDYASGSRRIVIVAEPEQPESHEEDRR